MPNFDSGSSLLTIRSAHFSRGKFEFRIGATLLHDSILHKKFLETENKAWVLLLDLLKEKEKD